MPSKQVEDVYKAQKQKMSKSVVRRLSSQAPDVLHTRIAELSAVVTAARHATETLGKALNHLETIDPNWPGLDSANSAWAELHGALVRADGEG